VAKVRRIGGLEGHFGRCGKEAKVYSFAVWSVACKFIYFCITRYSRAQSIERRSVTKQLVEMGVAGDCRGMI
jgi:hypothetical protein